MQNQSSTPPFETRIWHDLISHAAVGVYRVTLKGRFLWVNRKMAEIFGFESEKAFLASVNSGGQLWANREERNLFLTKMTTGGFVTPIEARSSLFLDEVGDLPFDLQAKLLHVLQDHSLFAYSNGSIS